jgi:hypothetical protein
LDKFGKTTVTKQRPNIQEMRRKGTQKKVTAVELK